MWWKGAAGSGEPAFRGRHKARKLGWAESAESGLCGPRSVASALSCVVARWSVALALSCVVARWERMVGQAMGLGREKGLAPWLGHDAPWLGIVCRIPVHDREVWLPSILLRSEMLLAKIIYMKLMKQCIQKVG